MCLRPSRSAFLRPAGSPPASFHAALSNEPKFIVLAAHPTLGLRSTSENCRREPTPSDPATGAGSSGAFLSWTSSPYDTCRFEGPVADGHACPPRATCGVSTPCAASTLEPPRARRLSSIHGIRASRRSPRRGRSLSRATCLLGLSYATTPSDLDEAAVVLRRQRAPGTPRLCSRDEYVQRDASRRRRRCLLALHSSRAFTPRVRAPALGRGCRPPRPCAGLRVTPPGPRGLERRRGGTIRLRIVGSPGVLGLMTNAIRQIHSYRWARSISAWSRWPGPRFHKTDVTCRAVRHDLPGIKPGRVACRPAIDVLEIGRAHV